MTPSKALTLAGLETVYDALATAIDQAGKDKTELFLVKLALLNANALGDAIARLHADPVLASTLAQAGRRQFEQHLTADHMVEQTLAVYAQALQRDTAR